MDSKKEQKLAKHSVWSPSLDAKELSNRDSFNLLWKIEGRRGMDRKQLTWLRYIGIWTGMRTAAELIHLAYGTETNTATKTEFVK